MSELPQRYEEILHAKYLDDLSMREISRLMNLSEKAVGSLLTRAREMFRVLYEQYREKESV